MSKYQVGDRVFIVVTDRLVYEGTVHSGPHRHNWPEEDNYAVTIDQAVRTMTWRESELLSMDDVRELVLREEPT